MGLRSFILIFWGVIAVAPCQGVRPSGAVPQAVRSIRFDGRQELSRDRALEALQTQEATFVRRIAGTERIEFDALRLELDLRALRFAYQKEGFLEMQVLGHVVQEDSVAGAVDIRIEVLEGTRYRIGEVSVGGVSAFSAEEVWGGIRTRRGRPADLHQVRDDAGAIRKLYRNAGFVAAKITFDTQIRDDSLLVDTQFRVLEGSPHSIRTISVRGNELTRPRVVRREMKVRPTDLYNLDRIREDQRDLYNTGLFSGVKISEVGIDTAAHTVDLRVELIERRPRWITFGVGSSTDERESFRFLAEWGHKNLLGTARLISLRAVSTWQMSRLVEDRRMDPVEGRGEIAYLQPWPLGLPVSLGATLFLAQEIPPGREFDRLSTWGITGRLFKRLGQDAEIALEPALEWANETVEGEIADRTVSQTNSLTLYYRLDSRENVFAPTRGQSITTSLTRAGGFLAGDFNYHRATTSFASYLGATDGRVFAYRMTGGVAEPFGPSRTLPLEALSTLGGVNSVRGYLESELSLAGTSPDGGRVMVLGNAEVRQRVLGLFGIAAFVDVGQVWPTLSSISGLDELRWSTGMEFRYQTPIGPVRVGYGVKGNPPTDDTRPGSWFFGFGQVF